MGEGLPFVAEEAPVRKRFPCHDTGIVDEELRGKVVRPVHDEIIIGHDVAGIVGRQPFGVGRHLHPRVQGYQLLFGRLHLQPPYIRRGMDDLALQVRQFHFISVDDADMAHTGSREIEQHRSPQPASPYDQHPSLTDLLLPFHPDVGQQDVPAVALQFVFRELKHRPLLPGRRPAGYPRTGRPRLPGRWKVG